MKLQKEEFKNCLAWLIERAGSTDQDMDLQNLIKTQQLVKPIKWLGFQI